MVLYQHGGKTEFLIFFMEEGAHEGKSYLYFIIIFLYAFRFPGGAAVKNSPTSAENTSLRFDPWVRKSSCREEMATHSSILAWNISWTEEPGVL